MSISSALQQVVISTVMQSYFVEKKNASGWGFVALSVLLFLIGLGFLIVAGYGFLIDQFDVRMGTLYMALIILTGALASAFAAHVIKHHMRLRARTNHEMLAENIRAIINVVTNELEEPIRENPVTAALVAAIAGYAAARKIL